MKLLQSITVALFLLVGISGSAYSQTATIEQSQENIETISVKVKGIGCSRDLNAVATSVDTLHGVSHCKAVKHGPTSKYEVRFNPAVVSEKEIQAAIEGTPGCKDPKSRPYKVKQ